MDAANWSSTAAAANTSARLQRVGPLENGRFGATLVPATINTLPVAGGCPNVFDSKFVTTHIGEDARNYFPALPRETFEPSKPNRDSAARRVGAAYYQYDALRLHRDFAAAAWGLSANFPVRVVDDVLGAEPVAHFKV